MLVESLIKETVELQGFRVVMVQKTGHGLEATLTADRRFTPCCGACGKPAAYRDTRAVRRFRHVPLWGIDVQLLYAPRRVSCKQCDGIHVEAMPWVSGQRRFTRALMVTLATWARVLTWKQVAALFRCSWCTVEAAVDEAVAYGLAHRDLSQVTHIGIDEISRKRGHVYVTNVYDLKSRQLLWSGEGRAKETLEGFFDWFGEERTAQLEGVCCDMWQPYADVVKTKAPKAILVFDKFHIVQHLTKAVDQVRRDEIREKGQEHKALMSKTRYIWLKNPWNLTDKQQARLSELEHLNLKINRAYLLKESFREFWTYTYAGWAERYLNNWFWWATHSRLKPMREFAWMLRRHQDDLMNYFRMPIHNGTVEGLNNKAKVISHKAYGFRSAKSYIRNLYHCMAGLSLPKTVHTFA
ncbi:ISL3 family transposase [Thiohalophilus sp.]|uniref:ISL3 family transposase n=1 Tax=Thiohalophilus sp. TaxID=3028392 RepID=UPI002ACD4BB5|nr:ISL3 family transposase [Thiohalophilus sp.]MDZ7802968.1 ISL3 family transposase [Thiohalophilus sp.]MDZ7802978.1 ISL3 family transposase [Thiohalophilus sp.]